jgi:light-regulated signal transduction histidine kinase (bacteriophytochrome)
MSRDVSPPMALTGCEREPIHIPGAIQPHGALLVLEERAFTVAQVSENVEAYLGVSAANVLGRPLGELIEPSSAAQVQDAFLEERWEELNPLLVRARAEHFHGLLHGIVHRSDGAAILELERRAPASANHAAHRPLRLALRNVQHAGTLAQLFENVVHEVQRLSGFERVMLYRFDEDGHGSVDAEAKQAQLEPYLGLHYPASDIPRQARELYLRNWLRSIPDATYTPARVLPTLRPETGGPLDLSHSVLRSVSPIHLEYLAHMGVRASMSISLIVRDRLWGLISCANHSEPRFISYELREACEVLGRLTSLQIAALEDQQAMLLRAARQGPHEVLVRAMRTSEAKEDVLAALLSHPAELNALVGAEGAALVSDGQAMTAGRCPAPEQILALSAWLAERGDGSLFSTASLPAVYPPAAQAKDVASGLLCFTLPGQPPRRLLWFRPELIQTVSWGGNPQKPVEADPGQRLHPRRSFALWERADPRPARSRRHRRRAVRAQLPAGRQSAADRRVAADVASVGRQQTHHDL